MLVTCPACGATNQEVGKFCEQCGAKVVGLTAADPADVISPNGNGIPDVSLRVDQLTPPDGVPDRGNSVADLPALDAPGARTFDAPSTPSPSNDDVPLAPGPTADSMPAIAPAGEGRGAETTGRVRFVRVENGVQNPAQSFVVPVGSRMLVGRTDPANGVFPDVDITMWSQRVNTPDGPLYTVHRKQCFVSRDADGVIWVVDYKEYVGDTMVSPAGSGQFRTIPDLASERETNSEGGVRLEIGDRILMGQAEGMIIFAITQE